MKAGIISALIFWVALFAAVSSCGQAKDTLIIYKVISEMQLGPTLKEGTYVVDTAQLRPLEMVPGFKYTIKIELADLLIQANSFTDQQGIEVAGQTLGSVDKNDWIKYRVNLSRPATAIVYRYAMADQVFGGVEFRTGSINGPRAGYDVLKPTGGWGNFFDVTIPVTLPAGPVDLFLTFTNSARTSGAGGNILQFIVK